MTTPAALARDYKKQLSWLDTPEMQILKTVIQSCYFGLRKVDEKTLQDAYTDIYPLVTEKVLGERITLPRLFNKHLLPKYPWLRWDDFHYKAFHRRTELLRYLERTPMHGLVIPVFNKVATCDVEGNIDYGLCSSRKRILPLIVRTEDVIANWERRGNKWIREGPDTVLPEGQRDPTRNFPTNKVFVQTVLSLFGRECYWCKCPLDHFGTWAPDHFYPWAKGGRTVAGNCVPTCVTCNHIKSDRWPSEHLVLKFQLESRGRLLPKGANS